MTERLYYSDSFLRRFDAVVVACVPDGDRWHVVLDRTGFYPTSGGQPFDLGTLGAAQVVEVIDTDDGRIVHVTTKAIGVGGSVEGEIDWARRFDHMQQHTGQHILSAAFDRAFGAVTDSFHLGADVCTIDLNRELTAEQIAAGERAANDVVWSDRPVRVRHVSEEEARQLPLRKAPARSGPLRLVEVEDCDLSACGGTHVAHTGMVGIIAIAGWERFKGGVRLSFVCGGRALEAHRRLRDITLAAGRTLSALPAELPVQVERLQARAKDLDRQVQALDTRLAEYRAADFRARAETIGPFRVVLRPEPSSDAATLRLLAQLIVKEPGLVAVLTGGGDPLPVVVARSADVSLDAGALVKEATTTFGGRGGGRPELAQAGVTADAAAFVTFLRQRLDSVGTG